MKLVFILSEGGYLIRSEWRSGERHRAASVPHRLSGKIVNRGVRDGEAFAKQTDADFGG